MMAFKTLLPDCDETHWPLAIVVAEARLGADGIGSDLDTIERWLAHEKPFALLLISAYGPPLASDAALLAMVAQRIGIVRDALHRFLLGIAVVVPAATADGVRQSLARLPLHMPLEIFNQAPPAAEWLRSSILVPAGLAIDRL
ncbi:hypothetical protein HGP16_32290 [Rhizobium sp. P40RR-XXII]|uniref:hypothetical protein n=1 Tax=unclassified Rhizobium TaxID=2613769 RepID=UPI0014574CAF|nr:MULTISPECIES: hypothetical protein [unclassified Rhizobium]NLR89317.1 hypothetical protein [Rhizobium sp. P28RR-XV]NLS21179.1 hypothetical protein [Rhizobium sp. P40RR-XXII]